MIEILLLVIIFGFLFRYITKKQENYWLITYTKDGIDSEEYVCGDISKKEVEDWVKESGRQCDTFKVTRL